VKFSATKNIPPPGFGATYYFENRTQGYTTPETYVPEDNGVDYIRIVGQDSNATGSFAVRYEILH
jgi:hypothetical protein